jgi:hypothetical protein
LFCANSVIAHSPSQRHKVEWLVSPQMLLLFETPAGYALFKVLDEGKIKNVDNIFKHFEAASAATGLYVFAVTSGGGHVV